MSRKHKAWAVSAIIALIFMVTHFWFGWEAAKFEAVSHDQTRQMDEYRVEWARDTAENMQSEFWQIAWQMALLAGILAPLAIAYEQDQEDTKKAIAQLQESIDRVEEDTCVVRYSGILDPPKEAQG